MTPRTLLTAAVIVACAAGCSKPKPAPKPFDCPAFMQRARDCEQATIDMLKVRLRAEAGGPDFDQQFNMLESRLHKRIAEGKPQKQCEKIVTGPDTVRIDKLKTCYASERCEAFAECLIGL